MIQHAYTGNVISQNVTFGIIGIIGRNAMSSRGDLSDLSALRMSLYG